MRIVIAGGHGKIALHLAQQLHQAGHQPVSLIRNPAHADDVTVAGGEPVLFDLEKSSAAELATHLTGARRGGVLSGRRTRKHGRPQAHRRS